MDKTLIEIQSKMDLLIRSYWLFNYSNLRRGVWEELFKKYLDNYYPESPEFIDISKKAKKIVLEQNKFYRIESGVLSGNYRAIQFGEVSLDPKCWSVSRSKDLKYKDGLTYLREISSTRNNKRTNFPRSMWKRDSLSWQTYYEGVLLLTPIYTSLRIEFDLVYKDKEIHKFTIPVCWSLFESAEGFDIKHSGRTNDGLVVSGKLDRSRENPLAHIVREIMRRSKLSRKQLDKLLTAYTDDPINLYSFNSKSVANIKSSILTTMLKANMSWSNFTRAIKVLGYTDVNLHIVGERKNSKRPTITTVYMRLD